MILGLGANIGSEALKLDNYADKDNNMYPNISQMPFIILRGKSNEIRKVIHAARDHNVKYGAFVNTMTGGTYIEQLDNTKNTHEESLVFYGAVLFGDWDTVSQITKKLSLYR